ncbi:NTF2-like N-terminal transpeptidase domain-containing protein [Sciscionella sediminilitoris]|uniref:NTF2-like N-terminal transpeptidase domain-containing protein n=1 Tax=Sciscionella sediminilitoris TaxID=1445613 RepID=UPI0004DFA6BF|nr:NTF2-like N-terminal transpeptidase domain-containing protein [Sciscionella sp. SE31]
MVIAVVLVLVFTLGGGASGVMNDYVSALSSQDANKLREVSCKQISDKDFAKGVERMKKNTQNLKIEMSLAGDVKEEGDKASAPIKAKVSGTLMGQKLDQDLTGTIEAQNGDNGWCVIGIEDTKPSGGSSGGSSGF